MSAQHVDEMNRAVAGSQQVREACRSLGRSGTVHYRLTDGPDRVVHWTADVSPEGLTFGLERPADPEVVIEAEYAVMVRATRDARKGLPTPGGVPPAVTGDMRLLSDFAPLLALARGVATVEVEFPDV